MSQEEMKKLVGQFAAKIVTTGMKVGLGTGSTASYFIQSLAQRVQEQNLSIQVAASSLQTAEMAIDLQLPLFDINELKTLDITFDGADEVDREKNLIKGGGGALLREKMLAYHSKKLVIMIDETKLVDYLGAYPLPIEITPFGFLTTKIAIERLGYATSLRKQRNNELFVTDNENYILDVFIKRDILHPKNLEEKLNKIPGVIEVGIFSGFSPHVLLAKEGKVQEFLAE